MAARRPLVQVNGVISEFVDTDTLVGAGGGSTLSGSFSISNGELSVDAIAGTAITSGSATIDFGSGSGTNLVSTVVTGQTGLGSGSIVKAWVSYSSTASHNAIEHLVTPIKIGVDTLVVNTGFKITAFSEFTLTGTFNVNWEWY